MKYLVLPVLVLMLVFAGCVPDYEDPYESTVTPEFNFPSLDPNRYHWLGLDDPFFEGWYFKVFDPISEESVFFIYGVQNPGRNDDTTGAFLYAQKSDGDFVYRQFPLSQFSASVQKLDVTIGSARATDTVIRGAIDDVSWNLTFDIDANWQSTMGMLTNIPGLPVNWHVNMLDGTASGTVRWGDRDYILQDAPAFQDHNWGPAFPDAWVWLQCNTFFDSDIDSLALAGGPQGTGISSLDMYMLIFEYEQGRLEFRSQDLNVVFKSEIDYEAGIFELTATLGYDRVRVRAATSTDALSPVLVPTYQGMKVGAKEGFVAVVDVYVLKKVNGYWEQVYESSGLNGAIEFGGALAGYIY